MDGRRWARWTVLIAVLGIVFAASGPPTSAGAPVDAKHGGVLRYGMLSDPQNWSPHKVVECQNQLVMSQIYSALLRFNGKGELVGDLAESWKWVDDKTVVFQLRKNVKWHNGEPLTAQQVVWSENQRLDPKLSFDAKVLGDAVEKWEAVDDHTVKLTLKRPDVGFLRWLTPAPGRAFVIYPKWDEKTAGQSAATTIGTGPFKYKSYEPGVKVEVVRNPDYFIKGMPYLDGIDFMIIPDADARMTGLRSGQLDMIEFVDFQQLPALRKDPNIYIPEGKGFYGARLSFDMNLPPTNDVRVRRALNYAVDRKTIVDAVLAGEGAPIWGGIIPPGRFGYAKELEGYWSYDPKKAKALLAEAGWRDTKGDGKLYNKDGQPLKVTFVTYGPSWWSQVAEIVQQNFRDIGVICDLAVKPWAEYREIRQKNSELPDGKPGMMNIIGTTLWGLDLSDMPQYLMPGGYNFNRYNNPRVREALRQALATTDASKREALLRQVQVLMEEDAMEITPVWITRSEAVRTRVKNFSHLNQDGCFGTLMWESYLDPK
jgi:peptide/nickel transport system substrate-binding protein